MVVATGGGAVCRDENWYTQGPVVEVVGVYVSGGSRFLHCRPLQVVFAGRYRGVVGRASGGSSEAGDHCEQTRNGVTPFVGWRLHGF